MSKLNFWDYLRITIFGFSLNTLWNAMSSILLPVLVMSAAPGEKNTYLGYITFSGILLAIIVQPLAGYFSDNFGFSWGRRRPYILIGAVISALLIPLFGFASGILSIFIIYCLLQISSNTAHGPWQGLIPDMVPQNERGKASGFKGFVEILGAVIGIQITGYFLSQRFTGAVSTGLFISLGILSFSIIITMLVTLIFIRENGGRDINRPKFTQIMARTFYVNLKSEPAFVIFIISRFLFLLPLLILRMFSLYLLQDYIQIADPVAGTSNLILIVGLCLVVMVFPAGFITDRIGRKPVIVVSGLISALGFLVLLLWNNYAAAMLGGALIGLANGAFMSSSWAMATDLVKKDEEAKFLGLTNLATGGASAAAAFAGPLIDFLNSTFSSPNGYRAVLFLCILFSVVSSVLILKIRQR